MEVRHKIHKHRSKLSFLLNKLPGWLVITSVVLLSGCMNAALTGADLVYHRNRYTDYAENNFISIDGQRQINESQALADTTISLTGFQSTALLVGHVDTQKQKDIADNIAWQITGVNKVINRITVGPKTGDSNTLADGWITTKIKSQMIMEAKFDPDEIKVTTEDGIVYLMGALTMPEAEQAINIASHTDGVKKVVTLITYLVPSSIPIPLQKHIA